MRPLWLSCVRAPCLLGPHLFVFPALMTKFGIFHPKSVPFPGFLIYVSGPTVLAHLTPPSPSFPSLHTYRVCSPRKACCLVSRPIHLHVLFSNSGLITSHLDHFNASERLSLCPLLPLIPSANSTLFHSSDAITLCKQLHSLQLPLDIFLTFNKNLLSTITAEALKTLGLKDVILAHKEFIVFADKQKIPITLECGNINLASRVLPFGPNLSFQLSLHHSHPHRYSHQAGRLIMSQRHYIVFCLWALVSARNVCPPFKAHHQSPRSCS